MSDPTTPPPPPNDPPSPEPASPEPASPEPASPEPASPEPAAAPPGGGSNNTLMLILSYLGPLALVPFLVEKDDAEVQWHAKHGIVLMLLWIVVGVVFTVLSGIPVLGCAAVMVSMVVPLIALVIHILCIVKALNGERFLLPGVSQYADKF